MSINALKARIARQKLERAAKEQALLQAQVGLSPEDAPSIGTPTSITTKDLAIAEARTSTVLTKPSPIAQAISSTITHLPTEHVKPTTHTDEEIQVSKADVDVSMFNTKQLLAVKLAEYGKSFCLIGAAGSGKTTTVRGVITTLKGGGIIGKLYEGTERVLRTGHPSVAVLSYTNQAVRNIKEALPLEFKQHCSTFHKLLEYSPEYDDVEVKDENGNWTGEYKKTMYYEPNYGVEPNTEHGKAQKLPHLDVVIVEEAGSVPIDLWETFLSALPDPDSTIFILLGDLNQLPPVFGDGILGYKLLELPIVELSKVYRNVGLVTQFAHRILEGKPISCKELASDWNLSDSSGTLTFNAFKHKTEVKAAVPTLGKHFMKLVINGKFDTDNDVLLVPFNKQLGTLAMNKWLNHGLDKRDNRVVHQVLAGYIMTYWAIGDKVLYNKQYCLVKDIVPNTKFFGDPVLAPSIHLDRWGRTGKDYEFRTIEDAVEEDKRSVETMMEDALDDLEAEGTIQASAIITLEACDESLRQTNGNMPTYEVTSAGQINGLLHVLAMSVHKSQGSEWQKVWMILHHSHAVMFQRELLYTGCTRARKDLEVYYSGQKATHKIGGSPFHMGILNQQIEGKTIEQKLKYFKNKVRAAQISESVKNGLGIPEDTIHPTILNSIEDIQMDDTATVQRGVADLPVQAQPEAITIGVAR